MSKNWQMKVLKSRWKAQAHKKEDKSQISVQTQNKDISTKLHLYCCRIHKMTLKVAIAPHASHFLKLQKAKDQIQYYLSNKHILEEI